MNDPYKPAFTLNGMLKDILLAQDAGANFPFTNVLAETFQSAKAAGYGGEEVNGVINYLKDRLPSFVSQRISCTASCETVFDVAAVRPFRFVKTRI